MIGSDWRKSSYSNGQAECVETGHTGHGVAVRDSKYPQGPALAFTPGNWQIFVASIKNH